jgi:ABC-type branched-subunit amino acid transport system ATPase component
MVRGGTAIVSRPDEPLLRVDGLTRRFGGVLALDGLGFELAEGEKLAVIGPNGAGKSTLLRLIAGQDRPSSGRIFLRDVGEVQGRTAHGLTRAGIALASQVPRPLATLTVAENVQVGLPAGHQRDPKPARERLAEILDLTGLARFADRPAGSLPLLDLKRLEVARALASRPRLLLLDEVSAGLNERDLDAAIELITAIHATGTSLLIVEHVQRVIHELADRVLVLNWGALLTQGTPAEVTADEEVRRVYLGAGRPVQQTGHVDPATRATRSAAEGGGLTLRGVTVLRGGLTAIRDVDLDIAPGEAVAVLGANGAGKSTLTQTISGLLRAREGSIAWSGVDITRKPAHVRARAGIAHCQEGRKLFAGLTVEENLRLGAFGIARGEVAAREAQVHEIFPILAERAGQIATTMSGGQQQMLAIGRALMSRPRLLLCDEVTLGLSPKVADEIYSALARVAADGTALLLVEQDAERCLAAARRAYVFERGRVFWQGKADDLDDATLVSAYLGADTGLSA